jgi:hypothetical protein
LPGPSRTLRGLVTKFPELPGAGRLGRYIEHDERSFAFPAEVAPKIVSVQHAAQGLPLDQGDVGRGRFRHRSSRC